MEDEKKDQKVVLTEKEVKDIREVREAQIKDKKVIQK